MQTEVREEAVREFSPAFSEDLGPASLPASSPPSPSPVDSIKQKKNQASAEDEGLRKENQELREAMKAMEGEVRGMMERWKEQKEKSVEGEQRVREEREEWDRERERLLDISNRLRAELRKAKAEREEVRREGLPIENVMDRVRAKENSAVSEIDKLRQALGGLIDQNKQLTADILHLTNPPAVTVPRTPPPPPPRRLSAQTSQVNSPLPPPLPSTSSVPPILADVAGLTKFSRQSRSTAAVTQREDEDAERKETERKEMERQAKEGLQLTGRRVAIVESREGSARQATPSRLTAVRSKAALAGGVRKKELMGKVRNYAIVES